MNTLNLWMILALAPILLSGCWGNSQKSGLIVVNVLDKALYEDCHIAGSINIQLDDLEKEFSSIDKEAEIVLYCSNYQCSTSEYVAKQLHTKGFKHVYVYEGGIAEWYQAGLPIEGPHSQAYLSKPVKNNEQMEKSDSSVISMYELAQKMNITTQDRVAA